MATDSTPRTWVRSYENEALGEFLESLNGVDWAEAPKPFRWHRCRVQTRGRFDGKLVERCPCGAIQLDGDGGWFERNRRR